MPSPQVESLTTTITVMNYKKCRAMKKFITSILIAAAALTACSKSEEITLNTHNKVTFTATATAPESRSVLVEEAGKYHAEWVAGDYLELYEITITGGTKKKGNNPGVTLTEGGKSVSVNFELEAKTADSFAYILAHNNASINGAATYLAFPVPNNQAPTAMNTYDPTADLIISKGVSLPTQPTETLNFEMSRVTALAKISIKNVNLAAGDAVKSVNFISEHTLTGKKTYLYTDTIIAGNDPMTDAKDTEGEAKKNVIVTLPEPQTGDFSYYASVWPVTLAAGEKCSVIVITNNDGIYTKEITLPKDMVFTSGDITAFTVNMAGVPNSNATPEEPEVRTEYITVAGIKWAAGNLEYEKDGATDTGFAAGWRLTETQYNYIYMDTTGDIKTLKDYNKTNYFNWGGIADPFSCAKTSAISMAASDPMFDYSGKMYTDQVCASATTDFAAAKFGDIAYWASNGKYRTPTVDEFQKLYDESCRVKATYTHGVLTINGTYYYNPGTGEAAGIVEGTKALTADDLKVGIFLPYAGRAYNGTEYNVYKIGTQGVYRTSTVHAASTAEDTHGVIYRVQMLDEGAYYNVSFGATARYLIRPVFVE